MKIGHPLTCLLQLKLQLLDIKTFWNSPYVVSYVGPYVSAYVVVYISVYVSAYVVLYVGPYVNAYVVVYVSVYVSAHVVVYVSAYVSVRMSFRMLVRTSGRMSCMSVQNMSTNKEMRANKWRGKRSFQKSFSYSFLTKKKVQWKKPVKHVSG